MILEEKGNGIYFIKNFLDDKEYSAFMSLISQINQEAWSAPYWEAVKKRALALYDSEDILSLIASRTVQDPWELFGNYDLYHDKTHSFSIDSLGLDIFDSLQYKWKNIFTSKANSLDTYDWDSPTFIERRYVGNSTPLHRDNDLAGSLVYATILYINDDFEGGDIVFPECGVSIQPEKGSLCLFAGESELLHGVNEVTRGTRYSIPIFVWDLRKDQTYRTLHK